MRYLFFILLLFMACGPSQRSETTAQDIIDRAISVSGDSLYKTSEIRFEFRDKIYQKAWRNGLREYARIIETDSGIITDRLTPKGFGRYLGDREIILADTTALAYAESVNSVHYFAYLPYGLNDAAVNKELLGEVVINDIPYHKVRVTFKKEGGGVDYQDVFVYWFNAKTGKPDFLAYAFQTNDGGFRFRKAINERYIGGLRFVDYENYKPRVEVSDVTELDSLYQAGKLELLSQIVLKNIAVTSGNYN